MSFLGRCFWCGAVISLVLLVRSPRTFGQATSGTVIGSVTDSTGAVVPGAKVTVTNSDTGVATTTTTNPEGEYTVSHLLPGIYDVAIAKQGFKTFLQKNLTVVVGLSTTLNATLAVGQTTENVTVSAAPPVIETERPGVSTSLSSDITESLPVLNRNFTNFELLVPGSTTNWFQHAQTENPQAGQLIDTNGQLFDSTNFMIDGMDNNDPVLGIVMVNPPVDSVQEFTFTTSNFDAEFSQAGGGVIQLQTKSGTNLLHGSAYEFLRNNIFEARDPFTQAPGGLPELRWNQFGGSLGGPLVKSKLFFFGDYQGARQRNGGSILTFVPTAAERAGDLSAFSAAGISIYDPTTGNPDGSGRTQFESFPTGPNANPLCQNTSGCLNMIPANRIVSQATALLNYVHLPNLTPSDPTVANYVTNGSQIYDTNQFDVRMDHDLSQKFRYFGRYSYGGYLVNTPGAFQLAGGPQFNGFTSEGISHGRNQNLVGTLTYVASPTLVGDVRMGYTRYHVFVTAPDESQQLATQAGIPGLNLSGSPDTWGLPDLNVGIATGVKGSQATGAFQMGYQCNCPLHETEQEFQWASNWTKYFGTHAVKWGADVRRRQNLRLPSDDHRAGVYDFLSTVTADYVPNAVPPAPQVTGGLGLAGFLLGDPNDFHRFAQISTNQQDLQWSMYYYISDTWRLMRKLTLTYGLRWDTWFADRSLHTGQGGRYDVTTNTVYIPGVGGVPLTGGVLTQYHNFSPRLGIAYAPNDKTVVRTGWGRSYFQGNFGWTFNDLNADIYPSIVSQDLTSTSSFFPVEFASGATLGAPSIGTPPPAPVFPTIPPSGKFPLPNGIGDAAIPTNQQIPYVDSWNFTIERELFQDATLSVGYVGNVGRHLNDGWNLNAPVPGPGTNTARQPLFAQFGLTQDIFIKCDCANSSYNALQARFTKRLSHNYQLLAGYTWSRTLDFGEWGTATDQYDYRLDYGPATFDRKHVFTLAHVVKLPFGQGQRWFSNPGRAARLALNGWEFTGITTVESGLVFSPTIDAGPLNSFDMGLRPNLIANPFSGTCTGTSPTTIPVHTQGCWFSNAAYAEPPAYTFGGAGRNSLYGPGLVNMDWALHKNFDLSEAFKLQFRWEVFNALNISNWANPNGNLGTITGVGGSLGGTQITDISAPMRNMQFAFRLSW